jgi:hypothetical protein
MALPAHSTVEGLNVVGSIRDRQVAVLVAVSLDQLTPGATAGGPATAFSQQLHLRLMLG